ncbi:NgoMIV family type II restriction endonuclease [Arthrobacter alpinus]|uniref:NgoMIV family type II restriction endonuclease n=1 Tax=Arthrobacter alpinus TaxID=656366 RepID=UPI0028F6DCF5|nr:NgoMIV family type II restriction endonuclease [Arthrobacter alpinus]
MIGLVSEARRNFHHELIHTGTLAIDSKGVASNADSNQKTSSAVAYHMARALGTPEGAQKLGGQTAGKNFETAVTNFLSATLPMFPMLRPGRWQIKNVGGQRGVSHLSQFEPYTHLSSLAAAVVENPTLASVLGNSYEISPDVLVIRAPEPDAFINSSATLVDEYSARRTIIRQLNSQNGIVHGIASCKWTLRSDRAQNARSEALNIIRNRKGRTPHIVVVTGEPTPSRIASLALGTGDLDTVYHMALPELITAVEATDNDEALSMIHTLLDGNRLRDISDLPLDFTV